MIKFLFESESGFSVFYQQAYKEKTSWSYMAE